MTILELDSGAGTGVATDHRLLQRRGLAVLLATAVAYVLVTWMTDPVFVADTPDFAVSAVARSLGNDCTYFEPGHLLWRPVGHLMLNALGTVQPGASTDAVLRESEIQLAWAAWFSGLVAIVTMSAWLLRRTNAAAATAFGVGVVLVSKAFVNFSQVGASYVPALGCLMVGLLLLAGDGAKFARTRAVAGGVLLGVSVLLWGTFALALPAALTSTIIFGPDWRQGFRRSLFAVAGGGIVALAAALWVSSSLGFSSLAELRTWASTASHGITHGGVPRAVLGFARSYLETGDYGRLVKRFLIGDPADPVGVRDLIGFPLIGILGLYAGLLLAMLLSFRTAAGRRALVFFAINALPVGLFAIAWQGGDLERYLPLVPGVALLAASGFVAASRVPRILLVAWLVLIIIPNTLALSRPAVAASTARVRASLRDAEADGRVRLLVFSHWQDERVQFRRNRPPREEPMSIRFYHLLTPGTPSVRSWRPQAAKRIIAAWDAGVEVMVSERLLAPVARREWQWVEGDDERVSWADFSRFFSALEYGPRIGLPGDGFLTLAPTSANRAVLEGYRGEPDDTRAPAGCTIPPTVPALPATAHAIAGRSLQLD